MLITSFRIAVKALRRHKLRTGLTMLGITIGVAAVITMVALGTGAQETVSQDVQSAGTNSDSGPRREFHARRREVEYRDRISDRRPRSPPRMPSDRADSEGVKYYRAVCCCVAGSTPAARKSIPRFSAPTSISRLFTVGHFRGGTSSRRTKSPLELRSRFLAHLCGTGCLATPIPWGDPRRR